MTGSILEIIKPESAVWDGTRALYPVVMTSDSEWTVDVCSTVATGSRLMGVYDPQGTLISNAECVQVSVASQTKVIAFEVEATGSGEPKLTIDLTVTNKKSGKVTKVKADVEDLRDATLTQLLLAHRLHAHERAKMPLALPPEQ